MREKMRVARESGDGASIWFEAIRLHAADRVHRWCRPVVRRNFVQPPVGSRVTSHNVCWRSCPAPSSNL
jgi:hypothetical protein